ncbi:unnamed protein product [Phytophthora fragariaefolia]|uniref:Unnamed protein product n=1 Tax=Phytophthora fragariaefolia TaxID=1490495 RepID=A0A9W6Y2F3_9STRA|nr:unnamed protein product [Phytophthora fragariaefolia]
MDSARAMRWATNLPKRFLGDAARYASYIRNLLPTRGNPDYKTPLEALTGQVPDVIHILKFGSRCTAHIKHKAGRSLMNRAGISEVQKGYILYLPRTKKVLTTPHVQNVDRIDPRDTSYLLDDIAGAADKDAEPPGPVVAHSMAPVVTQTTSVSNINSSPDNPNGHGEIDASSDEEHEDFGHEISAHRLRSIFEFAQPASLLLTIGLSAPTSLARGSQAAGQIKKPRSYAEAMSGPQCAEWRKAIEEELKAIADNGTWETIEPLKDSAMITNKWVFKIKFNNRGDLERFKARLVARGFTQRYGIDFSETFPPVLKLSSLRFLFVLAAIWHVQVRQGDVPNAYLKADIDMPIVMRAPPGIQLPMGKHLLLKEGLTGLKQSGRPWNELMHMFLTAYGLQQSKLDPYLYFCRKAGLPFNA